MPVIWKLCSAVICCFLFEYAKSRFPRKKLIKMFQQGFSIIMEIIYDYFLFSNDDFAIDNCNCRISLCWILNGMFAKQFEIAFSDILDLPDAKVYMRVTSAYCRKQF